MGCLLEPYIRSLVFPCDFPILDRQYSRILLEEFREAAGDGVTDHLGDLTHGEVGVDQKVFRPHAWAAFGTEDAQFADYRACATYGLLSDLLKQAINLQTVYYNQKTKARFN